MAQDYVKHETITIAGVSYVSPDCCSFGDYGGSGSIGLANIREIVKAAGEQNGEVYPTYFSEISHAKDLHDSNYCAFLPREDCELYVKVRDSKRKPLVLHATGDYSSETVFILKDSRLAHETLSSLASYPVLDDEESSSIEIEWESEAWESWLRSDLERAAWPGAEEPESETDSAAYSAMSDSDKFGAYRHAMEVENEYPEPELNGVHVRVERIASTYRATIESMLAGETLDSIARKRWPSIYSSPAPAGPAN